MKKLLIVLFLILYPLISNAASYYVDKDSVGGACSDSTTKANNNITHPWCTIQRGVTGRADYGYDATLAITAGDTLYIRTGTYYLLGRGDRGTAALNPANTGTSEGARITIQNYPGETVTITYDPSVNTAGSGISGPLIGGYEKHYITWKGASTTNLLRIVETTGGWSPDTGPVVNFGSNYMTFENLEIIAAPQTGGSEGDNHQGISSYGTSSNNNNVIIKGCKIHGFNEQGQHDNGIRSFNTDYVTIENCEFYNNNVAIQPKQANNHWTIRYNLFHDNNNNDIDLNCNPGARDDISVYQNIFYNTGGSSLRLLFYLTNLKVYNNTFYNQAWEVIGYTADNTVHVTFFNNIVHTPAAVMIVLYGGLPTIDYWNYNLYYGFTASDLKFRHTAGSSATDTFSQWKAATGYDSSSSLGVDPLFVNLGTRDFHLQAGSPARSGGRGGSYATVFGAYITGSETIGLTGGAGTTPSKVQGLTIQGGTI